jgi:hypothetical protein
VTASAASTLAKGRKPRASHLENEVGVLTEYLDAAGVRA